MASTPTLIIFDYYAPMAPFLEPLSKVAATVIGKINFKINFLAVFSKTDMKPQQHSLLAPRLHAKFSGKIRKFLGPQAEYHVAFTFLYCHYVDTYYVIHC